MKKPKTNPGTKKKRKSGRTSFDELDEKIREEIISYINSGFPMRPRVVKTLANTAQVRPGVIKAYWKLMARTEAKKNLTKERPELKLKIPSKNTLLNIKRQTALTVFKKYMAKTLTGKILVRRFNQYANIL